MLSDELIEKILVDYRWAFVCLFILPVSLVYNTLYYLRNTIIFRLSSAPKKHDIKVKGVQEQVKRWNAEGKKTPMCTARPGWQTMSFRQPKYKKYFYNININLVDILEIDCANQTVTVEPLATMGQVTRTLIPLGWTLPIVPELDDLTVGGLVMGTGVESSSHKYGLFQHICLSYELVLADGSIIKCSKESEPDLFYSVPWSYGTLGFLTSVVIQIVPCKPYVKIDYTPINDSRSISEKFAAASANTQNDFVEGIVFNENQAVLMTGKFASPADSDFKISMVNIINRWYKPWFFKHVEETLVKNSRRTEFIPLQQYYHRHTRSIFWELQDIVPFGNNVVFRALFGWLLPPKVSLLKLTQTQATKRLYENNHVIQDMLVPMKCLGQSLDVFHKSVMVYPIWLCPFLLPNNPGLVHPKGSSQQLYVDIGIYGTPKIGNFDPKTTTRKIEKFVIENNGFQMLYADTYMTVDEFRAMFDHKLYDRVRKRLHCEKAFPEIYNKVCKSART